MVSVHLVMANRMTLVFVLMWFLIIDLTTSENIFYKFFAQESRNNDHQPTDLSNSPIAMWMQQSGVAKRVCQRVESVEVYDSGISPRTAQVTMGRCRVHLERASAVPLTANQKVCPGMQACIPTMSEVIPLRTTNGIKDVTSAIDCTCAPPISGCQRHPWLRVFHRRTKYERVIDIGKCAGNCGNKRCQPLSIKKVAIKTPNGRKIVKVVEKCGCKSSCYRMSYKKAFQVVSGNGQNSNQSATKVIDIGICSRTSSCSGTIRGKCLYWADSSSKELPIFSSGKVCLVRSKTRRRQCYANKTSVLTINTQEYPNKEVHVIDSCACS